MFRPVMEKKTGKLRIRKTGDWKDSSGKRKYWIQSTVEYYNG